MRRLADVPAATDPVPDWQFDLLGEPIVRIRSGGRRLQVSLPELLHHIATTADQDLEFRGLRPHQTHACHAFLVQVMALVLHNDQRQLAGLTVADWQAGLLRLTGGSASAWKLVVADEREPAFLQAPLPMGAHVEWRVKPTPDEIDLPFTGRNWEVKAEQMQFASPDQWMFAIITCQTCNGYSGPGYQAASRMNGAYGTRCCFGLAPAVGGWAAHIRRDVAVLRVTHDRTATSYGLAIKDGIGATWTLPWAGGLGEELALAKLDPWYIENGRMMRLAHMDRRIVAKVSGSKSMRIAAKSLAGVVGDPWLPVLSGEVEEAKEEGEPTAPATTPVTTRKSLGLKETGFYLRLLINLFNETACELPSAAHLHAHDPEDLVFVARGVGRGQGKTLGIHELTIPITPAFRAAFATSDGRALISERAQTMIADYVEIRTKGVFAAATRLLRDKDGPKDARVEAATEAFERAAHAALHRELPELLAGPAEAMQARWRTQLLDAAETAIDAAIARCALGSRKYAGIAAAEGILNHIHTAWKPASSPATIASPPASSHHYKSTSPEKAHV